MRISFLVPTLGDRPQEFTRLLDSFDKQKNKNFEVVVIAQDNHNCVNTICDKYRKRLNIHLLSLERKGLSYARNQGIVVANSEILVLSDDDCWYPDDAVENVINDFLNEKAEILLYQIFDYDKNKQYKKYEVGEHYIKNETSLFCRSSIEIAFKKDRTCFFDEEFGLGGKFCSVEESDFLIRSFRCGKVIKYKPRILVFHLRKYEEETSWQLVAKGAFYAKNYNGLWLCGVVFRDLIIKKQKGIWKIIKGYFRYKMDYPKYPKSWRELIKIIISYPLFILKLVEIHKDRENRVILMGTPIHKNIGDQVLANESVNLLSRLYPNKKILQVPMPFCHVFWWYIKRNISTTDIIAIPAGGWLGDTWKHNELFVRKLIRCYRNNDFIILPQTVYYSDLDSCFYLEGKELYKSKSKIIWCLRERRSYDFVVNNLIGSGNIHVYLLPDLALMHHAHISNNIRNIVGVSLRNDSEQILEEDFKKFIYKELKRRGIRVEEFSTLDKGYISEYKREAIIQKKLEKVSSYKFVITDRLHTMIFAYITGTPCIAMDNKTGKVSGVYEWIQGKGPCYLASTKLDFSNILDEITVSGHKHIDNSNLQSIIDEFVVENNG